LYLTIREEGRELGNENIIYHKWREDHEENIKRNIFFQLNPFVFFVNLVVDIRPNRQPFFERPTIPIRRYGS